MEEGQILNVLLRGKLETNFINEFEEIVEGIQEGSGEKLIVSLVGGGGKTTIMYELASYFARKGKRVIATTTTHIFIPQEKIWAKNMKEVRALWKAGGFAVVGRPSGQEKLKVLVEGEWKLFMQEADIVFIEADGAKGYPCKLPNATEPVIPQESNLVIGVIGMDALGRTYEEVCFRSEYVEDRLGKKRKDIVKIDDISNMVYSENILKKEVGDRQFILVLNKCDDEYRVDTARRIERKINFT